MNPDKQVREEAEKANWFLRILLIICLLSQTVIFCYVIATSH